MLCDFFTQEQLLQFHQSTCQMKPVLGRHNLPRTLYKDLWNEISHNKVTWPQLSLLNNGRQVSPVEFTNVDPEGFRDLNFSQVLALYHAGYTIRVRKSNRLHAILQKLNNKGKKQLSPNCGINLYCSTTSSNGLGEHRDPYHIIIVQIKGEKSWSYRDNTEKLPNKIVLSEGDVMYLPLGLYHQTQTLKESMHLTISFSIPTVYDIFTDYIKENYSELLEKPVPFAVNLTGEIQYKNEEISNLIINLMEKK